MHYQTAKHTRSSDATEDEIVAFYVPFPQINIDAFNATLFAPFVVKRFLKYESDNEQCEIPSLKSHTKCN